MIQTPPLDQLASVTTLLGFGIPVPRGDEVPAEVVNTLREARGHMQNIPACIRDLEAALQEFRVLDEVIDRLIDLAFEASRFPEDAPAVATSRQDEFVRLSRLLAARAGRLNYDRPILSLESPAQAGAAHQALKHLLPVKAALGNGLREQTEAILTAVDETVSFLKIVAETYPDARSLSGLTELIDSVRCFRKDARLDPPSGSKRHSGIH